MSDSREQFEAWYISIHGQEVKKWALHRYESGDYRGQLAQRDWLAWQASRQALEIELPEPFRLCDGYGQGLDPEDTREAIESAGVRVKP